ADLVAGARRLDEGQPVLAGSGILVLRGEDLDDVARVERRLERYQATVDLRTHRALRDLGAHGVGEVDGRRTRGQADDLALRSEDIDLFRPDLEAQVVEELPRVGGLRLPVADVREPGHLRTGLC